SRCPRHAMDRGGIETKGADLETAPPSPRLRRGGRGVAMNWANRLTLGRLALTILFVAALSSSWRYGRTVALVLFLLAGLTDYFDGEIARRYGIVTKFGKLMDPLVDKVMMAAAFISLVPLRAVPAWG